MPRRALHCAYCGERLGGEDSYRWCGVKLPGKPEVGWHAGEDCRCHEKDALAPHFPAKTKKGLIQQLLQIEARGANRLIANKEWPKVAKV